MRSGVTYHPDVDLTLVILYQGGPHPMDEPGESVSSPVTREGKPSLQCLSFSLRYDKIPAENDFRKEGFLLARSLGVQPVM